MKTLRKYWILYRENLVMTATFQLIAFLIGMILVIFINSSINEDEDFAAMGSFFAMIIAFIFAIIRVNTAHMFLAVGMGQTRRSFLLCDTFYNVLHFLISIVLCRLFYFLEIAICARLYPGFENGMPLEKFFSLPVIGLLTAVVAGLGLLFMMLKVRFGQKAFVIVWISFWLLFMTASSAISSAVEGETGFLATVGNVIVGHTDALPWAGWFLIGYGFAVLLGIVGVLGLRRVEIRQ